MKNLFHPHLNRNRDKLNPNTYFQRTNIQILNKKIKSSACIDDLLHTKSLTHFKNVHCSFRRFSMDMDSSSNTNFDLGSKTNDTLHNNTLSNTITSIELPTPLIDQNQIKNEPNFKLPSTDTKFVAKNNAINEMIQIFQEYGSIHLPRDILKEHFLNLSKKYNLSSMETNKYFKLARYIINNPSKQIRMAIRKDWNNFKITHLESSMNPDLINLYMNKISTKYNVSRTFIYKIIYPLKYHKNTSKSVKNIPSDIKKQILDIIDEIFVSFNKTPDINEIQDMKVDEAQEIISSNNYNLNYVNNEKITNISDIVKLIENKLYQSSIVGNSKSHDTIIVDSLIKNQLNHRVLYRFILMELHKRFRNHLSNENKSEIETIVSQHSNLNVLQLTDIVQTNLKIPRVVIYQEIRRLKLNSNKKPISDKHRKLIKEAVQTFYQKTIDQNDNGQSTSLINNNHINEIINSLEISIPKEQLYSAIVNQILIIERRHIDKSWKKYIREYVLNLETLPSDLEITHILKEKIPLPKKHIYRYVRSATQSILDNSINDEQLKIIRFYLSNILNEYIQNNKSSISQDLSHSSDNQVNNKDVDIKMIQNLKIIHLLYTSEYETLLNKLEKELQLSRKILKLFLAKELYKLEKLLIPSTLKENINILIKKSDKKSNMEIREELKKKFGHMISNRLLYRLIDSELSKYHRSLVTDKDKKIVKTYIKSYYNNFLFKELESKNQLYNQSEENIYILSNKQTKSQVIQEIYNHLKTLVVIPKHLLLNIIYHDLERLERSNVSKEQIKIARELINNEMNKINSIVIEKNNQFQLKGTNEFSQYRNNRPFSLLCDSLRQHINLPRSHIILLIHEEWNKHKLREVSNEDREKLRLLIFQKGSSYSTKDTKVLCDELHNSFQISRRVLYILIRNELKKIQKIEKLPIQD